MSFVHGAVMLASVEEGGDLGGGESLTALEAELRRLEELGALDAPGGRGAAAALAAAPSSAASSG